jgi:hypothetical protein
MSVRIYYIYADDCKNCRQALQTIKKAVSKCEKTSCEISKFDYNTKAALGIAATQGINELPGFVIGDSIFQGNDYSEERIINAINKADRRNS